MFSSHRFPVANEVSIRDGLMHSFAGMWYGGAPALRGQEAFRGRALECAFFSSVAIGGLLSGYPVEMVKNHVESAQASVVEFRGLADKHAVSALILSGMMNILLPPAGAEGGGAGGAGGGTAGSGSGASGGSGGGSADAEGRRSLDEAEAIFESLPEKDPLVGVILSFRRMVEGLAAIDPAALCPSPAAASKSSSSVPSSSFSSSSLSLSPCTSSSSKTAAADGSKGPRKSRGPPPKASSTTPSDPLATGASGGGGKGNGGSTDAAAGGETRSMSPASASVSKGVALTAEGKAILAGGDAGGVGRGDSKSSSPVAQPAHPSFVASDGKTGAQAVDTLSVA